MKQRSVGIRLLMFCLFASLSAGMAACGDKAKPAAKGPQPTLITVVEAVVRPLESTETSMGSVENVFDPVIAAEVAGRVTRVLTEVGKPVTKGQLLAEIDSVDLAIQRRGDAAEVARLEALVGNQERIVQREQKLVAENFISQNAADESIAQRNALRQQLAGARAQLDGNQNALSKSRILSPIQGAVEERMVSPGAYVKVGDPLFKLVGKELMRVRLPFPESAAPRLKIGQTVQLSSPLSPETVLNARIDEIRPSITETSRAMDVIARFQNDGNFRGGGTVNAKVVTGLKERAVMVPEESVVLRPIGKVVYLIRDGKAVQQAVKTGGRAEGMIEILEGVSPGEVIARDGAGFLTQDAKVSVREQSTAAPALSIKASGT